MLEIVPKIETSKLVAFLEELNSMYQENNHIQINLNLYPRDSLPIKSILSLLTLNTDLNAFHQKVDTLSIKIQTRNISDLSTIISQGVTPRINFIKEFQKNKEFVVPNELLFDNAQISLSLMTDNYISIKLDNYGVTIDKTREGLTSKIFPLISLAEKYKIPIKH